MFVCVSVYVYLHRLYYIYIYPPHLIHNLAIMKNKYLISLIWMDLFRSHEGGKMRQTEFTGPTRPF